MSEAKRVSLQSIGSVKKDKKTRPSVTSTRLDLALPPRDADTYADFNYKTLILNERKKERSKEKEEVKVNGFGPLDPYASDDEDKIKEIARSFESKYGTPKKKYRRLEDYSELGTGYDENDSFIDNTDAFDEAVPEDQTPECGGFYVNKGQLVLKRVDGRSSSEQSDSDSSEGLPNSKGHKRRLESDSESSSSDSSGDSSETDDSEDSEEEDENEAAEIDTEEPPPTSKENKTNGHDIVLPKKPKLSDDVKCSEYSSKKAKNKAITGLFLKKAVREKERDKDHNENRQNLDSPGGAKRISNIDAAIEAVARGEDSKESGIAESKSHSDLSDSYDSDESHGSLKVNGNVNGLLHPLPEGLPAKLLAIVSDLKAKAAAKSNSSKQEFFSKDVDSLLLRFEKNLRHVQACKRGLVYDHLQCYLPCSKESLMKKGSALLQASVEAAVKEPLAQLKAGIDSLMPNAMERYRSVCQMQGERKVDAIKDTTDNNKSSPEKIKIPRRRFPWTEELKNILCVAVRKRRIYFHVMKKNKEDTWDDHLKEFMKKDVLPMFEVGWMKVTSLLDIVTKICPDLLKATPGNQEVKKKSILPSLGGKKSGVLPKAVSSEMVLDSPSVTGGVAPPPPPPPTLSPATVLPQSATTNPTPPPPPLSVVSPLPSPVSPPTGFLEAEPAVKKSKSSNGSTPDVQHGSGLLDLSNAESGSKKGPMHSSGPTQIDSNPSSTVHLNNSVRNISIEKIIGMNKLSSLSTSVSLSVKPVQSSSNSTIQSTTTDTASYDVASKKRHSHGNAAHSSKSSHINSSAEVDILNLKSQYSGNDGLSSSLLKRLPVHHSGSLSVTPIQSSTSKVPFSSQSLETQKTSSSSVVFSTSPSQSYSSHNQQPNASNTIKVSSVAAINLKLSSQSPSSTASHPLKTLNLPNVTTTASSKQSASTFSTPSVISHCLESNNPSLSITPVKPFQQGKTVTQAGSTSVQTSSAPLTSQANFNPWSERSEVIVTPSCSSNMPHIKTAPVSLNSSSFRPDSAISYTSSNSNISNLSAKKLKPSLSQNEAQGMNSSRIEKNPHMPSPISQDQREKPFLNPPYLFSSPVALDQSITSFSTSPSPSKQSEKVMVSRKDRILQESRDRGVIDSSMPTLSGPYRSSNVHESSGSLRQQSKMRAPPSRNQHWDDDFFSVEDLLSSSPTPVLSPKVATASMDSYKYPMQVSESQRFDPVKNHPPLLESQRAKSVTTSSNSESQRVIVRHGPVSHSKESAKPTSFINSQSRDQKTIFTSTRVTSAPSSCILDSTRANVVMTTSTIQESKRVVSLKDEMNDILASIPSQMISRTDHYTINSMQSHHNKRGSMLSNVSDIDVAAANPKEEPMQTAQELSMHGTLMSRTNCDVNFSEDRWSPAIKKTGNIKSSEMSDHRLSGMSSLSMSGLDGMGGMGLGLPPHLVGYQNDYQRHLYGSTSKSGQSDHRPT